MGLGLGLGLGSNAVPDPTPNQLGGPTSTVSDLRTMGLARPLPPTLVPARRERSRGERANASAAFQLGVRVPAGAFGMRAPAPVERMPPLERAETAKIFLAGGLWNLLRTA